MIVNKKYKNQHYEQQQDDEEEGVNNEGGIGIVHHEHPDYEVMAKRLRDFDDHEIEEEAKRHRKSTPPPKKLNNEQWDLMFDRLVKYKEDHGVRRGFAVHFHCMQSSIPLSNNSHWCVSRIAWYQSDRRKTQSEQIQATE
jgi:hypothetical protein